MEPHFLKKINLGLILGTTTRNENCVLRPSEIKRQFIVVFLHRPISIISPSPIAVRSTKMEKTETDMDMMKMQGGILKSTEGANFTGIADY